jgi:hypothetical protein
MGVLIFATDLRRPDLRRIFALEGAMRVGHAIALARFWPRSISLAKSFT